MKRVMILFSAAALLSSCGGVTEKSATQSTVVPAIDLANLDTTCRLNNDFYQYATGGWQKNTPLKDEYARYGSFDVLRENNEYRIKELFADLATQKAENGSVNQKISDLYNMGLDSVALNNAGATPVLADLKMVAEANDRATVSRVIARLHLAVGNPFFGMYAETDLKNSAQNTLYIAQSGLGMGTRDYYLEESNEAIREAYKRYITELFTLAGYSADDAVRAQESVMAMEMAIAEASTSNVDLRDPYANYNNIALEQFKKEYSAIDWDVYAETMGLEFPAQINVGQLKQMAKVNDLVANSSAQELKDYLSFNVLNAAASYLSDDFSNIAFDFYGKTMSGKQVQQPRWKRALAVPNGSLSEAVGQMYVAKYFPAEYKERMLTIVGNLQKSLSKHIANLDWMSDATKAKAQEKLSTIYVKVGYPDTWKAYNDLVIDPSKSYWDNMKQISVWHTHENFAKLNKPVDREEWGMSPQTVNAYYNPTTNEICFPAAILQPPFFNPDADDAVNYGAIGVVIGHEMTHGFDDQGRQFDKEGNLNDWWTAEDAKAFDDKTKLLVKQFDAIEVLPGVFANGAFTLGENIADQGGLRVAYTAMKDAQNGVEPASIDGFNAEQRFYLGYAGVWAQNIRDEEVARLTNVDPHSLGRNRVNQTLKNLETFYQAFGITDGDMYLAPEDRVVIW